MVNEFMNEVIVETGTPSCLFLVLSEQMTITVVQFFGRGCKLLK